MTEPAIVAPRRQVQLLPAAWGGLVGAIGLMIGLALEPTARNVVVALAFLAGGFVAGTRAPRLRIWHALLATLCGYVLFAAFIVLANLIARGGGPDAPEFAESGASAGVVTAIWAIAGSVLGAVAAMWFARGSRRRS